MKEGELQTRFHGVEKALPHGTFKIFLLQVILISLRTNLSKIVYWFQNQFLQVIVNLCPVYVGENKGFVEFLNQ